MFGIARRGGSAEPRRRPRTPIGFETLESRIQPDSGSGLGGGNTPPVISDFTATQISGGTFLFSGRVTDEYAAGLVITFGGDVPSLVGQTTTTASDGTFAFVIALQTDGSDDGTVDVRTVDNANQLSNNPWALVQAS